MKNELRWGFLGNARIASRAILPALGASNARRAVAIASRDREGATRTAIQFGIDRIYEDYQALIADPNVDAAHIGLPNSAHAYWIRAAVQAGKHVLCEKPITLSAAELEGVADLAAAQGVFVQEALMVWTRPRWRRVRQLLRDGRIGCLRAVQGRFCFMSKDPNNIRNKAELGGGGLLDLGVYLVSMTRFLFEDEPTRGLIDVETPFTPSPSADTRLLILTVIVVACELQIPNSTPIEGNQLSEQVELFPAVDQYATQLTAFTEAVPRRREPAVPLASSIANMRALDALNTSARSGAWKKV